MDSNKLECLKCMDNIKKRLDNLGFSTLMTGDKKNILCKYSGGDLTTGLGDKNISNVTSSNSITATTMATTCPVSRSSAKCPYPSCIYPSSQCHLHRPGDNTESGTESDSSKEDKDTCVVGETLEVYTGSLFRIMPNDIYSGLLLHVIKLHGETCELKMPFDYTETGVMELVNVIKFLVK